MYVTPAPRLGLFILCYNVGPRVAQVIDRIPQELADRFEEILVIDNCSTDDTLHHAIEAVKRHRMPQAQILSNTKNVGYGGSHKIAFEKFLERGLDYAVLLHGDGQGDPEILRNLIEECEKNRYDFVMGSRFLNRMELDGEYPWLRTQANLGLIALQKLVSGVPYTDPASPQMAYGLKLISALPYRELTDSFHFTPQLLLLASEHPVRFIELPMPWGKVETSSVNIWKHGWSLLKLLLGFRLRGVPLRPSRLAPSKLIFPAS